MRLNINNFYMESNIEKPKKKIFTDKFFRNVWLLSLLVFIGNIAYVVLSPDNSSLPEGKLLTFVLVLISSFIVGSLSFLLWILFLMNNRLSTNEGYSSFRNKAMKVVKILMLVIPILFVLFLLTWTYLISTTLISGESIPIYKDGSVQIICKICKDIKRGNVVIYSNPSKGKDYIGRIVGLPNENITIEKKTVSISGIPLPENYADWSEWTTDEKINITLGNDEYLALFDRRKLYTELGEFINIHKFKKSSYIGKIL